MGNDHIIMPGNGAVDQYLEASQIAEAQYQAQFADISNRIRSADRGERKAAAHPALGARYGAKETAFKLSSATVDESTKLKPASSPAGRCQITVHNLPAAGGEYKLDQAMLAAVMTRMATHIPFAGTVDIHTAAPDAKGWQEWLVMVKYPNGYGLTVGAIQRAPGERYEFHS